MMNNEQKTLQSKPARDLWGRASKDPAFRWEVDHGGRYTGRIVHNVTGQVLRRVDGRWRGVRA